MDQLLIAIGSAAVGKISEYTVDPVSRQVSYLFHYKSNLQNLQNQMRNIEAAKDSVHGLVVEEERNMKEAETSVKNWLKDVDNITNEAKEFMEDLDQRKGKMKCLNGFCPNMILRYRLSRKSRNLEEVMIQLHEKREFSKVAHNVVPHDMWTIPSKDYEAVESRRKTVNEIMEVLRNPDFNMIGVYGIGGVGKTTLVKEVFRQAAEEKLFDDVVKVLNVTDNPDLERIQKEIFKALRLKVDDSEALEDRAPKLCEKIKNKNTLVIFDDVWGSIDLEAIGIPHVANCKILLTSRTLEVLSHDMGTQKDFALDILNETETWSLFEKKAGHVVKDPIIRAIATEVAKKCGGLPVLIVTVASALKSRSTVYAWKDALKRLKRLDKEELTRKPYLGLEWSYNQLDDEELKPLFLLHGKLGGGDISFHKLFNYAMGLGLFKKFDTVEEAWNGLLLMVEKLKDACLLLDGKDNTCVKMHDVVHSVAIFIASRDQQVLYEDDLLKKWENDKDYFAKCTAISFPYRDIVPKLPEVLQCRKIEMFYVYNGKGKGESLKIPNNFFERTKLLQVLGLENLRIPSLPSSLEVLKNLRTLSLDLCDLEDISLIGQLSKLEILSLKYSSVKQLPKEIEQLTSLRLLDLTGCSKLEVIPPNVISSLQNLEDLRVRGGFKQWEAEGGRSNASLLELKQLSKLTALDIHIQLDANILPADLFSDKLERYQIWIGASWKWYRFEKFKPLNTLKLELTYNQLNQGLKMLLKRTEVLELKGLDGVTDFVLQLNSDGFQRLKELKVQNGASVTYIIDSVNWSHSGYNAFPSLEKLALYDLVSLESICHGQPTTESFRRLRSITLGGCHKLRAVFPFSIARSFLHLERVEVQNCDIMEHIFAGEIKDNCDDDIVYPLELSHLRNLRLRKLPKFIGFSSKAGTMDREFKEISSSNEIDIRMPVQLFLNGKVVFPNLTQLSVRLIGGFKFLLSSSMARSLRQLEDLYIYECHTIEEIVSTQEFSAKNTDNMFDKLQTLWLHDLPNLTRFCSGSYIEFPSLEDLSIHGCNKFRTFIIDPAMPIAIDNKEIDESDLKEDLQIAAPYCIFDEKARFPRLEELSIKGLTNLRIWHNQLDPKSFCRLKSVAIEDCDSLISIFVPGILGRLNALDTLEISNCKSLQVVFELGGIMSVEATHDTSTSTPLEFSDCHCRNLGSVEIRCCENLKYIFPAFLAKDLQQLRELDAVDCGLEEIIAKDEGLETVHRFVFSKATSVQLKNMPQLRSFYPGIHVSEWPLLEDLTVTQCVKLEVLAAEFSSVQEMGGLCSPIKHLFSVDKGSFPNLEDLKVGAMDIWYGASPPEFFGKLEYLEFFHGPSSKQPVSLEIGEHSDWTFPHLRSLRLREMRKLKHVWKERAHAACPVIPNLETLQVLACSRLKYLESSTISFQNLTSLDVVACHRLKYLFTSSVARTLMHLTEITVVNCMRMRVIVAKNKEDAESEIAFSQLQRMKLCYLQSLKEFCSENCIVKFPSLKSLRASNPLQLKINRLEWKMSPELEGVEIITEEKDKHYVPFSDYYNDHIDAYGSESGGDDNGGGDDDDDDEQQQQPKQEQDGDDDDGGVDDQVAEINEQEEESRFQPKNLPPSPRNQSDFSPPHQSAPPTENQEILISVPGQSAPQTAPILHRPIKFPFSDLKEGFEITDTTSASTVPCLTPANQDVQMQTSEIAGSTSGQTFVPGTQESELDRTIVMSCLSSSAQEVYDSPPPSIIRNAASPLIHEHLLTLLKPRQSSNPGPSATLTSIESRAKEEIVKFLGHSFEAATSSSNLVPLIDALNILANSSVVTFAETEYVSNLVKEQLASKKALNTQEFSAKVASEALLQLETSRTVYNDSLDQYSRKVNHLKDVKLEVEELKKQLALKEEIVADIETELKVEGLALKELDKQLTTDEKKESDHQKAVTVSVSLQKKLFLGRKSLCAALRTCIDAE